MSSFRTLIKKRIPPGILRIASKRKLLQKFIAPEILKLFSKNTRILRPDYSCPICEKK
jgi:hypothetical protein